LPCGGKAALVEHLQESTGVVTEITLCPVVDRDHSEVEALLVAGFHVNLHLLLERVSGLRPTTVCICGDGSQLDGLDLTSGRRPIDRGQQPGPSAGKAGGHENGPIGATARLTCGSAVGAAVSAEILAAGRQGFVAARIAAHLDDAELEALGPQAPSTGAVAVVEHAVGDRAAVEHGVQDAGRLLVVAGAEK
jgi:hypothetical protein